ncbi:MAG: hypothetical protein NDI69_06745 [Bacteriovoracaceae bacterium]|nr:hypothetical protein [Bacteriovoracaceae bacterium]
MKCSLLVFLIFLTSCSSLKKSVGAGAIIGGIVGGAGGVVFSPNEYSKGKNAYMGGVIGAIAGAGLAYLFHDEPKKKTADPMLLDEPGQLHKKVPLFDFSPELKHIRPEVNFKPVKKYEVPLEKLPTELEGKVKKQFIIEYESDARTLEIDNRTIQISPFKAWEHIYEK